jgi:hypothetical protein
MKRGPYLMPGDFQLRLMSYLRIDRKDQPGKQDGTQQIIDKDFDTFVCLHDSKNNHLLAKAGNNIGN